MEDLEEDEFWVAQLFEPVRRKFFIPPPPKRPPLWFMKDEPIQPDTTVVCLIGVHQEAKARIWKEVHLFKERRMIHIYGIRTGELAVLAVASFCAWQQLCRQCLWPPAVPGLGVLQQRPALHA